MLAMSYSLPKGVAMSSAVKTTSGSAERWGPLWGARPDDWAIAHSARSYLEPVDLGAAIVDRAVREQVVR